MNSTPDDGAFVDELLGHAKTALGDPRIQFVHVRHTGRPPADAPDAEPMSRPTAASVAQREAWTQAVELGTTLRDLWEHAWLPDPPSVVDVRYPVDSVGLRVEVTAHSETTVPPSIDTAAERLVVRGFLPDDAHTPGRIRARNGTRQLVVDSTGQGVSMALSEALDISEHINSDALGSLPDHVSLIADSR